MHRKMRRIKTASFTGVGNQTELSGPKEEEFLPNTQGKPAGHFNMRV